MLPWSIGRIKAIANTKAVAQVTIARSSSYDVEFGPLSVLQLLLFLSKLPDDRVDMQKNRAITLPLEDKSNSG